MKAFIFSLQMLTRDRHKASDCCLSCRKTIYLENITGLGMFCQSRCDLADTAVCQYDPKRQLKTFGPYDHLRCIFRVCVTHFKRNVHDLRSHISDEVRSAMLSLASSEKHPNLDGAFDVINNGGSKARGMIFSSTFLDRRY